MANILFHNTEEIAAAALQSGKIVFYPYPYADVILPENAAGNSFALKISEILASGQSYRRWCGSVPESNQPGTLDAILHPLFRDNPVEKRLGLGRFG